MVAVVYRVWGSPLGQQLGQLIDFKVLVKLFGDLHQGGTPLGLATLAHKALTNELLHMLIGPRAPQIDEIGLADRPFEGDRRQRPQGTHAQV